MNKFMQIEPNNMLGLRKEALLKVTARQKFHKHLGDLLNRFTGAKAGKAVRSVGGVGSGITDPSAITQAIDAANIPKARRLAELKTTLRSIGQDIKYTPEALKSVGRRVKRKFRAGKNAINGKIDSIKQGIADRRAAKELEKSFKDMRNATYERLDLPFESAATTARNSKISRDMAGVKSGVADKLARNRAFRSGSGEYYQPDLFGSINANPDLVSGNKAINDKVKDILNTPTFIPYRNQSDILNNIIESPANPYWRATDKAFSGQYGTYKRGLIDRFKRRAGLYAGMADRFAHNNPYAVAAGAMGLGVLPSLVRGREDEQ